MHNSRLIRILKTIPQGDLKKLKLLVQSPYFNANEAAIELLEVLIPFHPEFNPSEVNYINIGRLIKTSKRKSQIQQIKTCSALLALVEQFLLMKWVDAEPVAKHIAVMEHISHQDDHHDFESYYRETIQQVEEAAWRIPDKYYWRHRIEQIHTEVLIDEDKGAGMDSYIKALKNLNIYFSSNWMLAQSWMLHRNQFYSATESLSISDQIIPLLNQNNDLFTDQYAKICNELFLLFRDYNHSSYQYIKQQMVEGVIIGNDRETFFNFLESGIQLIFKTKREVHKELFSLFQYQVVSGDILTNGIIYDRRFRNVVIVAISVGELDWCLDFIDTYSLLLSESDEMRNNIRIICQSMVEIERKEYDKVLRKLSQITSRSVFIKLDERRIRMKVLYETRDFQVLSSFIPSFRKYITDNKRKLSGVYVSAYREFLSGIHELINADRSSRADLERMKAHLETQPNRMEQRWFIDKIEEILAQKTKKKR